MQPEIKVAALDMGRDKTLDLRGIKLQQRSVWFAPAQERIL